MIQTLHQVGDGEVPGPRGGGRVVPDTPDVARTHGGPVQAPSLSLSLLSPLPNRDTADPVSPADRFPRSLPPRLEVSESEEEVEVEEEARRSGGGAAAPPPSASVTEADGRRPSAERKRASRPGTCGEGGLAPSPSRGVSISMGSPGEEGRMVCVRQARGCIRVRWGAPG